MRLPLFVIAVAVGLVPAAMPVRHAAAPRLTHLFVAPGGSDAGTCTRTRPCATFDRAYRVAHPGDTVEIAGGAYPTQVVQVDRRKVNLTPPCSLGRRARCVVFRPVAGATVTIEGDLVVYASNALFLGSGRPLRFRIGKMLRSEATPGQATSHNVTFDDLHGAGFEIGPNHHITIKGGNWGPNYVCGTSGTDENKVGPDGNIPRQWPHDVVLDGLRIHDQNSYHLDLCHMGGLFLISGHNITLRNSIFSRNAVYDIQVQDFTNADCCGMKFGQMHDVLMENNWFGPPVRGLDEPNGSRRNDLQPELQLDGSYGGWKNWLIRFNSFYNGLDFAFRSAPTFRNVRVIGNIGDAPGCNAGARGLTWAFNAWRHGRCGRTDVNIRNFPYRDVRIGSEDYHLTGGRALNLVRGKGHDYALRTDIDGQKRPQGRARDAGADEVVSRRRSHGP
jgi:hypothetical protein